MTEDLRGLLLRGEEFARVQALRAKREAGASRLRQGDINRTGRVAKVIAIAARESIMQRRRRPITNVVPPAWQPVIESVSGTSVAAGAKRRHLEVLITAFARNGILSPCQLPSDADYLVFMPSSPKTSSSPRRSAPHSPTPRGTEAVHRGGNAAAGYTDVR